MTSQQFESYLPIYDAVPEKWEKGRQFLVEQLKKISDIVNLREIGFFLNEELLSGKQFIPGTTNNQEYRSVFRKVVLCSPLVAGLNTFAHGIAFDVNFTLIDLWVSATDPAVSAITMSDPANVTMDTMNINITSPGAFDRAFAFVEYIKEL